MFDPIDAKKNLSQREEEVLHFWEEQSIFLQTLSQREGRALFTFYDGPPFATGLPHYGHLLAGTIKDVVPRYKTMKGYHVPRRFGWDCHGLPIENEIEKAHNLSGAATIEAFGIAKFNEECRAIVLRYNKEWKSTVLRMGRWVDFDKTYRTMDVTFMESVWWVFKQLYEKGLVYKGFKVMPYSPKLGTPLSNFEAGENYKEVDDPSLTVMAAVEDEDDTFLLIWTTTPWTLISNIAICCGKEIDYVKVKDVKSGKFYYLAEARLSHYFTEDYEIVERVKGAALEGKKYEPLFCNFKDLKQKGAFRVITDSFVSTDDGTGLVHTAPGFGEADFYACQAHHMPFVCPVGQNGHFTREVPEYEGRFVKDCDKDIIKKLKAEQKVFRHETLRHRYPFCWRSDTPLIYKAVSTWFVAVEKIKDKLVKNNEPIAWMPDHIKYGRFGKWLEGARDWAISRNRYWGTPIPIWQAEDGETIVLGSIEELQQVTGERVSDLHRHFIDHLTFERNGKTFTRTTEVFDCWFESGSMPYAQNHYPFENEELFRKNFPADFIAEGLDQTRAWFYVLTVLSTALFDKPAFKNVVVNGIVLASDGQKMSKRLKNYPDPLDVVAKYGADAIRLYLLSSPAVKAEDLCFSEQGVEVVLRQVLLPLWNSYSFFITYARLYHWTPPAEDEKKFTPDSALDRWLLSMLQKLIHDVEVGMDRYDLSHSVAPFVAFVEQLTNWYIRRSRRRFWSDEASKDRDDAFRTLYTALTTLVKVTAPFIPFISDAIWRNMRRDEDPISVHLCDYPVYHEEWRSKDLEERMALVQRAVSLGHSLRKESNMKVRQPLAKAYVILADERELALLKQEASLIMDELNVQEVEFSRDETRFVTLQAKPNFRLLGKKIGKLMKAAQLTIEALSVEQLAILQKGGSVDVVIEGQAVTLTAEDVQVERTILPGIVAKNDAEMIVALDTELTEVLIAQGHAREFVNRVNTMRKEKNFDISDRIRVTIETDAAVQESIQQHREFISSEILATALTFAKCDGDLVEVNGIETKIEIQKV